jgi:hypothetical protein
VGPTPHAASIVHRCGRALTIHGYETEFVDQFSAIPDAITNVALREQASNYFRKLLPKDPKREDEHGAAVRTAMTFPLSIDYYIERKEDNGKSAVSFGSTKVAKSEQLYLQHAYDLPINGGEGRRDQRRP